jgi:hypothetical protein
MSVSGQRAGDTRAAFMDEIQVQLFFVFCMPFSCLRIINNSNRIKRSDETFLLSQTARLPRAFKERSPAAANSATREIEGSLLTGAGSFRYVQEFKLHAIWIGEENGVVPGFVVVFRRCVEHRCTVLTTHSVPILVPCLLTTQLANLTRRVENKDGRLMFCRFIDYAVWPGESVSVPKHEWFSWLTTRKSEIHLNSKKSWMI